MESLIIFCLAISIIIILFVPSIPINLMFSPRSEKEVNFNLRCTVPRKVFPLSLNVKAEGYAMNSILQCEDSLGNRVELSERGLNQINFGEVRIFFFVFFVVAKVVVWPYENPPAQTTLCLNNT